MNNSESFQPTEYKLGLVMSLNSTTTVRLRMYSHPLLRLKLFGETCGGSCESYQHSVSLCYRLLTFTAVQKDNYISVVGRDGQTGILSV